MHKKDLHLLSIRVTNPDEELAVVNKLAELSGVALGEKIVMKYNTPNKYIQLINLLGINIGIASTTKIDEERTIVVSAEKFLNNVDNPLDGLSFVRDNIIYNVIGSKIKGKCLNTKEKAVAVVLEEDLSKFSYSVAFAIIKAKIFNKIINKETKNFISKF